MNRICMTFCKWKEESTEIGPYSTIQMWDQLRTVIFWKCSELRLTFISSMNPLYHPNSIHIFSPTGVMAGLSA